MNNMNIAIIGSTGSIGNAFVRHFSHNTDVGDMHAFSRSEVYHVHNKVHQHQMDIENEKSIKDLDKRKLTQLFTINAVAPAIIAKHFLPKLSKDRKSIFAALSARVGSISDNKLGGWCAYRASKAALNMIIKNCAIEIYRSNKKAIVIGLHPGTVDSNLSKPFQPCIAKDKLFTPKDSVSKLTKVIDTLQLQDSGKVFDYKGEIIEF